MMSPFAVGSHHHHLTQHYHQIHRRRYQQTGLDYYRPNLGQR